VSPDCRAEFQRTALGILIYTRRLCFRLGQRTSHVRRPRFVLVCLLLNLNCFRSSCADKGSAKIARQLGFDYAEAVVRIP
jgi:hypothetical protein